MLVLNVNRYSCSMANYRTSDQAKKEYVSAMGDDLGATYHMLW